MSGGRASKRRYLVIAALVAVALAVIAGVVGGIPPLLIPLLVVALLLWAPVAAATALIPLPLMIALAIMVLVVAGARAFVGRWRGITWVLLAVNAPFVLWMAWVVNEYPRPCFEVVEVPIPGSDMVELVSDPERPVPCPVSYWNTEGAHVEQVVLRWLPVLAVLGFIWFITRPKPAMRLPTHSR